MQILKCMQSQHRKRTGHVELNHDLHASAATVLHQLFHIGPGVLLRIGVSTVPQPAYGRVWENESNERSEKNQQF